MTTRELAPAAVLAEKANRPYPNDSDAYRAARKALLAEEIELRRHIERVAEMRRALPPGGVVPKDYVFTGEAGTPVKLSELFDEKRSLFIYTWMFGPKRKRPCPMCTGLLGALDGNANDIMQKIALAVVARSPIERQIAFKKERGWQALPLYADEGGEYARDYHGVGDDDEDWAAVDVFTKEPDGTIRHTWGNEMGHGSEDPGQDPRGGVDLMPMWNVFDLTPEGRDPKWYPKLEYGAKPASDDT
jgi:predicted dithiol-disulfide oxidoreductase (DUF899 family)